MAAVLQKCLVMTCISLDGVGKRKHGVYQRLQMLIAGIVEAGFDIHLICVVDALVEGSEQRTAEILQRDLQDHWGLPISVLGVKLLDRDDPLIRAPYKVRMLLWAMRYGWRTMQISLRNAGWRLAATRALADTTYDLMLVHRLSSAAALSPMPPQAPPMVFDLDDLEHVVLKRHADQLANRTERWLTRLGVGAVRRAERQVTADSALTLVCSDADAALLVDMTGLPASRFAVVPNGADLFPVGPPAHAPILIMVGIYLYEPNAEGAGHFHRHIWPLIRQARPDAEVWFVGGGEHMLPFGSDASTGVKVLGFVDDLQAIYRQARVVICPLLVGGGTRVKIIEAAALSKAIVSTTLGAEGLDMAHERHILIADAPADFANACVRLLADVALSERLGREARAAVAERYDRVAIQTRFAKRVHAALGQ